MLKTAIKAAPLDMRSLKVREMPEAPAAMFHTSEGRPWPEQAAPVMIHARLPRAAVLTLAEADAGCIVAGPYVYARGGMFGACSRRIR